MKTLLLMSLTFSFLGKNYSGVGIKISKVWLEGDDIPEFIISESENTEVYLFLLEEITTGLQDLFEAERNAIEDKSNHDFYRVYYKGGSDELVRFVDYNKNGRLFRDGEVLYVIDTLIYEDRKDSYTQVSRYTFQIQEFYTGIKNLAKKAEYKAFLFDSFRETFWGADGVYKAYFPSGIVKKVMHYKNGLPADGEHKIYHENGRLARRFRISDGVLEDSVVHRSPEGEIVQYVIYNNGEVVDRSVKDQKLIYRKKALIIANGDLDEYSFDTYWDVHYTVEMLKSHDFQTITTLHNETATKEGILTAFDQMISEIQIGDVVYIHISGLTELDNFIPYGFEGELNEVNIASQGISRNTLLEKINLLRIKAGLSGQVVLIYDACNDKEFVDNTSEQVNSQLDGFRSFVRHSNQLSPYTLKGSLLYIYLSGLSYLIRNTEGNQVGALTFALSKTLTKYPAYDYHDLEVFLRNEYSKEVTSNNLLISGDLDAPVFQPRPWLKAPNNNTYARGDAWIISVGISDYPYDREKYGQDIFANTVADARSFDEFFTYQFSTLSNDSGYVAHNQILLNEKATKGNIIEAVNRIIQGAKENDYFIFNFSGYTVVNTDSTQKQTTWFVPNGLNSIADTTEIIQKGISLNQLKDLFQFIPAHNQLFITEAGQSKDFQKEFVKALIESNPVIASMVPRNRIIMVPREIGMDYFNCSYEPIAHGPLNYFITTLPAERNIFEIFEDDEKREKIKFALKKQQIECNSFDLDYVQLFFEQDFIQDLQYYFPETFSRSRGANYVSSGSDNTNFGDKHALVIGTNIYQASDQWDKLSNPVLDAKNISSELKENYGYKVRLLIDPPFDSIYHHLIYYAQTLDSADQFILYVAGHGDFDELLDDGMIVCVDSESSYNDMARNSYIQYSKLSRMINKFPAHQIMVLLDVCFGGTFDVSRNVGRSKNLYDGLDIDAFVQKKARYKTRLLLSSGGKNLVPDGYAGKHSPFAYKLLEALRSGGGKNGLLTASDLYQFVQRLPSEPFMGSFGDDEAGSEFLLIVEPNEEIALVDQDLE